MKKLIIGVCLLACVFAAGETSIGGVKIGDTFEDVVKKYSFVGKWGTQELTSLPYPLSVGQKDQVFLAQAPNSRLYFYFDEFKKVIAVGLFTGIDYTDTKVYETSMGLRATDGLLEMKVLYGNPLDISEYDFKDNFGDRVVRRMYYYPNMIIQTRKVNSLPEQIDNVIICKYKLESVLKEKDYPLANPAR